MTEENDDQPLKAVWQALVVSSAADALYRLLLKQKDVAALTPAGVIQTYRVDTASVYRNPLGGIGCRLIINDTPDLHIAVLLKEQDGELYNAAGGESQALREQLQASEETPS